jgi:folate-binding protein YgfZ
MSAQNITRLPEFSVIKLTGVDAVSFLQGQVSCDVTKLAEQKIMPGCHCNAKGKAWSTFIAVQHDADILLVLTKQSAEVSLAELNKYGVFAKVDITDESENWFIYGSDENLALTENADISIPLADEHFINLSKQELTETISSESWWKTEILSGRAHLYTATSGEYVPQMINMQALDYISFNKGCYMGQEMIARMRYLGKNKRALYIASSDNMESINIGDDVYREVNGNKRSAGKVINVCHADSKTYLQLVLPNDTDLADPIFVNQTTSHSLTLMALPYSLEQS